MTKGMGNITNVFAMGKGVTESTSGQYKINKTLDSVSNYTGNFLESAIYKTPLNPLLTRGVVSEDFADFTAASNATTINSYEIHKADNLDLVGQTGIYNSRSGSQVYSAVNRIIPNTTTVNDYILNLETTTSNTLKIYDLASNTGQRMVLRQSQLNETLDNSETVITLDSSHNVVASDTIIVDNEEMLVISVDTNNLTVIRGYNGTVAAEHINDSGVYRKLDRIYWVLLYSDDPNSHHFAKITEILTGDILGDTIEFSPPLGVDVPKNTKLAIFSSYNSDFPLTDSENQTLVACGYGLQSDSSNIRHYVNTLVSRPFFYFINGKDKLEPSTRYILRSSSWNGTSHTYTASAFVTEPEYNSQIVDYGPYTMEATLVDMMYKADNPAAINFLEYTSNNLELTNGSPDTITVSSDASFDNSITNLDGTEGTTWGIRGILRDSRFSLSGTQTDTYCIDSATDSEAATITMDSADFNAASAIDSLQLNFTAHSVDLDHNKMYCAIDSSNTLLKAFRMAHRPILDVSASNYYGHSIGQTRYLHYANSPLTNTIIPNALEMVEFESVTSTGGYVDIVFADTQKILAKKIKQNDPIYIHQIVANEEVGPLRNRQIGLAEKGLNNNTSLTLTNLQNNEDPRFLLTSPIPNSKTLTLNRYNAINDSYTVDVEGMPYHFVPDIISDKNVESQNQTIIKWRKGTDTEYKLLSATDMTSVPNFSSPAYRKAYSFLADNIMTNIPIDTNVNNFSLNSIGSGLYQEVTAQSDRNWYRNVTDFESVKDSNIRLGPADEIADFRIGEVEITKASQSRVNDVHLVLRGGQMTGHRLSVEYGDKYNSFIKLKTHLRDDRFLDSYNRVDYLPHSDKISSVSLYGYPINSGVDTGNTNYRYNLQQSGANLADLHVRGVLSYLDYFKGSLDIEKRVFKGTVESVEQVVEDGMFKLKIRGRNDVAKLLGPVVNKNYKFTEDIIYSTVGPIERMAQLGNINHSTNTNVYEVGTTVIRLDNIEYADNNLDTANNIGTVSTASAGDLLYTAMGTFLGRIYSLSGSSNPFTITFEEGIPTRLKDDESIFISGSASAHLSDITPLPLSDSASYSVDDLVARGNMVSFSKAMSSNPYTDTRVNSLLGATNKGIIFTGGNSLTLTNGAPLGEGNTLVGTSSSTNPLAKGYSINSIGDIDYDLPFYCHLADEITKNNTTDYVNLHTVNSLTDYEVVNLTSNEGETVISLAPICPAVLARVDNNPLDGRDKILVTMTLDRPLFEAVTTSTSIHKYYSSSTNPKYRSGGGIRFDISTNTNNLAGTNFAVSRLFGSSSTAREFLRLLEPNMRLLIEGGNEDDLNGVFTISHVNTTDSTISGISSPVVYFNPRKLENGKISGDGDSGFDIVENRDSDTIRLKVLTDYFTQGLYFLNTQGLTQGGVLTLTNNYLSSPNAYDNICKPIKWAGGLFHFLTDTSVTTNGGTAYNPNASAPVIFSDMIDRYGNTKWRYFGLQRGKYLSYINRRRKDGQIKDTYTTEKGRVSGYASAYRIADAKFGNKKVYTYPYGYHNNDFSWKVAMYDPNIASPYLFSLYDAIGGNSTHPYFLEYLSPESRDFRPVTGSNFADFTKHGTYVTSPEDTNHRTLQYPRFMPRIHDNFGGGDWQLFTKNLVPLMRLLMLPLILTLDLN